jgi:hypothetical protein
MANAFAANIADSLLAQPDGARIRPMAEALALVFAACLGICGAALAVVPLRENSTRRIGLVGLILGLTPFPMGVALMKAAIRARHLILLP